MAELDKTMTDLGDKINELDRTITNLGNKITGLDGTITNLGNKITGLDGTITNLDKTATDTYEERKFELYKQLHEQYAVNDNNKTSSVISFLAAIFSVFVGYGFAFYYDDKGDCLVAVTIASQLLFVFICILCLYFGYSTRRDQFITHKIRGTYHVNIPYSNPFDRKTSWFNYLPDYYAIMYYGCIIFMLLISATSVWKLSNLKEKIIPNIKVVTSIETGFFLIVLLGLTWYYKEKYNGFKKKEYKL